MCVGLVVEFLDVGIESLESFILRGISEVTTMMCSPRTFGTSRRLLKVKTNMVERMEVLCG